MTIGFAAIPKSLRNLMLLTQTGYVLIAATSILGIGATTAWTVRQASRRRRPRTEALIMRILSDAKPYGFDQLVAAAYGEKRFGLSSIREERMKDGIAALLDKDKIEVSIAGFVLKQ